MALPEGSGVFLSHNSGGNGSGWGSKCHSPRGTAKPSALVSVLGEAASSLDPAGSRQWPGTRRRFCEDQARHHLRALGGASTPAPPLRQSPQEGPGPSDAQWRRGQTRVLQKLRAAGPDPSPIGQHPPPAPAPGLLDQQPEMARGLGGGGEPGGFPSACRKAPVGHATAFRPLSAAKCGSAGGRGCRPELVLSGLWLAWAGSPSRPCRAAQGRGARVRVGDLQCCGGPATGPGPTRPPSQGPLLVRLGSRVPAGGPEAAPAASCCAARAPPKALNVESAQHRGFLSLVITPFCPHPWAPPTACWGPGGLRPSHAAGTGWALAGSSLAAALCLEERASPGGRQVGRWVLCPGLPPRTATSPTAPNGGRLFPHSPLPASPSGAPVSVVLGLSDVLPFSQGLWSLGLASPLSPD